MSKINTKVRNVALQKLSIQGHTGKILPRQSLHHIYMDSSHRKSSTQMQTLSSSNNINYNNYRRNNNVQGTQTLASQNLEDDEQVIYNNYPAAYESFDWHNDTGSGKILRTDNMLYNHGNEESQDYPNLALLDKKLLYKNPKIARQQRNMTQYQTEDYPGIPKQRTLAQLENQKQFIQRQELDYDKLGFVLSAPREVSVDNLQSSLISNDARNQQQVMKNYKRGRKNHESQRSYFKYREEVLKTHLPQLTHTSTSTTTAFEPSHNKVESAGVRSPEMGADQYINELISVRNNQSIKELVENFHPGHKVPKEKKNKNNRFFILQPKNPENFRQTLNQISTEEFLDSSLRQRRRFGSVAETMNEHLMRDEEEQLELEKVKYRDIRFMIDDMKSLLNKKIDRTPVLKHKFEKLGPISANTSLRGRLVEKLFPLLTELKYQCSLIENEAPDVQIKSKLVKKKTRESIQIHLDAQLLSLKNNQKSKSPGKSIYDQDSSVTKFKRFGNSSAYQTPKSFASTARDLEQQIITEEQDDTLPKSSQIKDIIQQAMDLSMAFRELDPALYNQMISINERFLSQNEKEQIWVVKQRNDMLVGARELETQIENDLLEQGILPKDQMLPPLEHLKSEGKTLKMRIGNYRDNLGSLERAVQDECGKQFQSLILQQRRYKKRKAIEQKIARERQERAFRLDKAQMLKQMERQLQEEMKAGSGRKKTNKNGGTAKSREKTNGDWTNGDFSHRTTIEKQFEKFLSSVVPRESTEFQ